MSARWSVGEEVVLIEAAVPAATREEFDTLVAMLERRRFLKSCVEVVGSLEAAVEAACAASAVGVRLLRAGTEVREPAALVTCAGNAHLALAIVADGATGGVWGKAQRAGIRDSGTGIRDSGQGIVETLVRCGSHKAHR